MKKNDIRTLPSINAFNYLMNLATQDQLCRVTHETCHVIMNNGYASYNDETTIFMDDKKVVYIKTKDGMTTIPPYVWCHYYYIEGKLFYKQSRIRLDEPKLSPLTLDKDTIAYMQMRDHLQVSHPPIIPTFPPN